MDRGAGGGDGRGGNPADLLRAGRRPGPRPGDGRSAGALRLASAPAPSTSRPMRRARSSAAGASGSTGASRGRNFAELTATKLARADLRLTVGEFVMTEIASALRRLRAGAALRPRRRPASALLVGLGLRAARARSIPDIYVGDARQGPHQEVHQPARRHHHADGQLAALRLQPAADMEMVSRESQTPMAHGVPARRARGRPGHQPPGRDEQPAAPGAERRPRPADHRHQHPARGRRQPGADPGHHRPHHPGARPHQGRDRGADRPGADVGLRHHRSSRCVLGGRAS